MVRTVQTKIALEEVCAPQTYSSVGVSNFTFQAWTAVVPGHSISNELQLYTYRYLQLHSSSCRVPPAHQLRTSSQQLESSGEAWMRKRESAESVPTGVARDGECNTHTHIDNQAEQRSAATVARTASRSATRSHTHRRPARLAVTPAAAPGAGGGRPVRSATTDRPGDP